LYAKKREKKKTPPALLQPKPITQLNKLHNGNTYRRLPPNTNLFFSFCHYPSPIPPTPFSSQKLLSP
jgi:hypothetical protein